MSRKFYAALGAYLHDAANPDVPDLAEDALTLLEEYAEQAGWNYHDADLHLSYVLRKDIDGAQRQSGEESQR